MYKKIAVTTVFGVCVCVCMCVCVLCMYCIYIVCLYGVCVCVCVCTMCITAQWIAIDMIYVKRRLRTFSNHLIQLNDECRLFDQSKKIPKITQYTFTVNVTYVTNCTFLSSHD